VTARCAGVVTQGTAVVAKLMGADTTQLAAMVVKHKDVPVAPVVAVAGSAAATVAPAAAAAPATEVAQSKQALHARVKALTTCVDVTRPVMCLPLCLSVSLSLCLSVSLSLCLCVSCVSLSHSISLL
jgi:hypothetical protein